MRQTSFADFHCSLSRSLEVMGDWWSPLVLRDVFLRVDTFGDIVRDLGISRNLLTQRLASLVEHGLLEKVQYQDRPARSRYVLTVAGGELVPILAALTAWGDRWQTPEGGPPMRFRHGRHRCTPEVTCSTCGERVEAESLQIVPGPGGREAPGTMVVARRLGALAQQR
ncbi:MAG: putative transcriptional regulator [Ilumatobacteraceae bacterium]|nr:putative transcriptional regulator [Ilumatobacteraceae bacterium]